MSTRILNDLELHETIPSLSVEEVLLIEIKRDDKWLKFYDFDGKTLTCNVCSQKIFLPNLLNHSKTEKHKQNWQKIQRLYHPRLTQQKSSSAKISEMEIKQLEGKAKHKARIFNGLKKATLKRNLDKKIRSLCLKNNTKDVRHIFVNVGMPLEQLLQLEYQNKQGEWKPLLTTERVHQNSRFLCTLCSVYCGGIITVAAHFGGNSHMNVQLTTQGVRHKTYRAVTKNCRFFCNPTFVINVNERGRQFYKERAEKYLQEVDGNYDEVDQEYDINELSVNNEKPKDNLVPQSKSKEVPASKAISVAQNVEERQEKSNQEEGLIGVEYVIKLLNTKDSEIVYECVLCESVFNEIKMQAHLISHDHRLKYCDMHYGDTMKKYKDMVGHMRYNDFYCAISPLLSKLAYAIEDVHSRAVPVEMDESEFMKKRGEYVAEMYGIRHACQGRGPSFSKTISMEEIAEFRKKRHTFREPTVSNVYPCRFTTTPKAPYLGLYIFNMSDRLRNNKSKSPDSPRQKSKRSRHNSETLSRSPLIITKSTSKRERASESPTTKMWKQYDKDVAIEKKKIDKLYDNYRKQPEDHPLYEQEWNRFWKQRRDELIAEGVDHRTYNYQAEWVHYFKNRLEELFCEAVLQVKEKVRANLHIPIETETWNQVNRSSDEGLPPVKIARFMTDPFGLQQMQQQQYNQQSSQQQIHNQYRQQQAQQQHPQQRALNLPMQASYSVVNATATLGSVPGTSQTPTPVPVPVPMPIPEPKATAVQVSIKDKTLRADDKPNVIHVLRLMTAMEDHLGSLGSKVMDLFMKALQLEKKCNNNAVLLEKCVLTPDNCNLLEVAMEKLKGVLFAGLLEGNKANSFNKIIKSTEELLTYAESRGWRDSADDVAENSNATMDIQKLISVIQTKGSTQATQQKSLSDTLKELMSGKMREPEHSHSPERSPRGYKNENFHSKKSTSYGYDRVDRDREPGYMGNDSHMNNRNYRQQAERNEFDKSLLNPFTKRLTNDANVDRAPAVTSGGGQQANSGDVRLVNYNHFNSNSSNTISKNDNLPFRNMKVNLSLNSNNSNSQMMRNNQFPHNMPASNMPQNNLNVARTDQMFNATYKRNDFLHRK